MSLYKPSELKAFLEENQKKANKRLSQNFLIDKNILDKIIQLNMAYKAFPALEIGPGPGALTEQLLQAGFKVTAIELDQQFAELLKKRLTPFYPQLEIIQDDFLKTDLKVVLQKSPLWSVVANLPYHITSKALIKLLMNSHSFSSLTLMVQKEFFDRVMETSGKDYGIINILCRLCSSKMEGFKVSASCFYPAPRVDSAVLHLQLNCPHSPAKMMAFYEFLKTAFVSRRKKLISNLQDKYSITLLKECFKTYELDENIRVEALNPEQYFQLFNFLSHSAS